MHEGRLEKDIRFTEKKVDESWKEQAAKGKGEEKRSPQVSQSKTEPAGKEKQRVTSKPFLNLLHSLGFQVMMHLGEIPNPDTGAKEPNLEAARQIIDLITQIREKTQGNLSTEENEFFSTVLPELQLKFAQHT